MTASAGTAAVGKGKDQQGAQAGKAGEIQDAVSKANELDQKLQKASPAQKKLLQQLAQQSERNSLPIPSGEWLANVLEATEGISEQDVSHLAGLDWGKSAAADQQALKQRVQQAVKNRQKGKSPALRAKQQTLVDLVKGPKGDVVSDAALTRIAVATQSLSESQLDKLIQRMQQLLQNKEGVTQPAVVIIEAEAARIAKNETPPPATGTTNTRREPTAEEIKTIKRYYRALKAEIEGAEKRYVSRVSKTASHSQKYR